VDTDVLDADTSRRRIVHLTDAVRSFRGAHRYGFCIACLTLVLALMVAGPPAPWAAAAPAVNISSQSEQTLQALLAVAKNASSAGLSERSEILSRQFLGTPYGANTLIGSATVPEQLVVELQKVDCFTYADYVEALKRGGDREEFIDGLIKVRYKDGVVSFQNRKHFFTDWSTLQPAVATDVTASLGADAIQVTKNLNKKDSGGL